MDLEATMCDEESGAEPGLFFGWRSGRTLFGTTGEYGRTFERQRTNI
jgi:hypothetical protein